MSIQNIEHVVVLMLENRSFDSMLGWLYEHDAPANNIPPAAAEDLFRGLQPPFKADDFVNTATTAKGHKLSAKPTRGVQGFSIPDVDPGEEFENVNTQFYGVPKPAPDAPITMKGVMADFVGVLQKQDFNENDVERLAKMTLECFTSGQLPVLNQLAKHYAVCDDWFASVPSQTNPNRAFLMCGTSNGMVNNGELETNPEAENLKKVLGMAVGDDRVDAPTIFNELEDAGVDWNVFWQTSYLPHKISTLLDGLPILIGLLAIPNPGLSIILGAALGLIEPYRRYLDELTSGELSSSYTWRLFPQIKEKIPNAEQHFQKIEEFHRLARIGELPKFSYIEPYWSISHTTNPQLEALFSVQGNDYHPPSNLIVGEEFVKEVYTSLISNRDAWKKTLLLITFDEFVGTFDHVTKPLRPGVVAPPWGSGQPPFLSKTKFKFDRLGARVPTIVVSPYVEKKTVFRHSVGSVPYDHTSVIATTLKWLGRSEKVAEFGARAAAAPTFENVLTLDEPRKDEKDLKFLDTPRKIGDPVQYGDAFLLKNQDGKYLSSFITTTKASGLGSAIPESVLGICVDLQIAAYFPTVGLGQRVALSFFTHSPDPADQIEHNTELMLVSRESGLGALNILGAWEDSVDCYYSDEYIDGDNARKQKWIIQKRDNTDKPLHYGDQIYITSSFFRDQRLTRDTRWLVKAGWITKKSENGDYWTLEPDDATVHEDAVDGSKYIILSADQRVVSWNDGFQTLAPRSYVDGVNCVVLNAYQRVVSWNDGYQTCEVGARVDGTNCVILDDGQRVVSSKDGYNTCKIGDRISPPLSNQESSHPTLNCLILNAGARVVSHEDGYTSLNIGSVVDGTNCVVLDYGQRVVSSEDGYNTCKIGDRISPPLSNQESSHPTLNCLILNDGARVVSHEDGYKSLNIGSVVDGTNCVVLDYGQRVVSSEDGYKTCKIGDRISPPLANQESSHPTLNCLILNAGARVVSHEDGYTSLNIGSVVDGTNCVVLDDGQRVVSSDDGYQTCKIGSVVDGTNCVILDDGQRVVSWDDGYQTCKVGSVVDGVNCVILDDGQRVVSWENGYQTCKIGDRIDGAKCVVLDDGQRVVSWQEGYQA